MTPTYQLCSNVLSTTYTRTQVHHIRHRNIGQHIHHPQVMLQRRHIIRIIHPIPLRLRREQPLALLQVLHTRNTLPTHLAQPRRTIL